VDKRQLETSLQITCMMHQSFHQAKSNTKSVKKFERCLYLQSPYTEQHIYKKSS